MSDAPPIVLLDPSHLQGVSPAAAVSRCRSTLEQAISNASWEGSNPVVNRYSEGAGKGAVRTIVPGAGAGGLFEARLVFPEGRLRAPSTWTGRRAALRILRHALDALNAVAMPGMGEELSDPKGCRPDSPSHAGAAWAALARCSGGAWTADGRPPVVGVRISRPTPWSGACIAGADAVADPWTLRVATAPETRHVGGLARMLVVRTSSSAIQVSPLVHDLFDEEGDPMERLRALAAWQAEREGKAR